MSKIKVKISETKFLSFYKTLIRAVILADDSRLRDDSKLLYSVRSFFVFIGIPNMKNILCNSNKSMHYIADSVE